MQNNNPLVTHQGVSILFNVEVNFYIAYAQNPHLFVILFQSSLMSRSVSTAAIFSPTVSRSPGPVLQKVPQNLIILHKNSTLFKARKSFSLILLGFLEQNFSADPPPLFC